MIGDDTAPIVFSVGAHNSLVRNIRLKPSVRQVEAIEIPERSGQSTRFLTHEGAERIVLDRGRKRDGSRESVECLSLPIQQ